MTSVAEVLFGTEDGIRDLYGKAREGDSDAGKALLERIVAPDVREAVDYMVLQISRGADNVILDSASDFLAPGSPLKYSEPILFSDDGFFSGVPGAVEALLTYAYPEYELVGIQQPGQLRLQKK